VTDDDRWTEDRETTVYKGKCVGKGKIACAAKKRFRLTIKTIAITMKSDWAEFSSWWVAFAFTALCRRCPVTSQRRPTSRPLAARTQLTLSTDGQTHAHVVPVRVRCPPRSTTTKTANIDRAEDLDVEEDDAADAWRRVQPRRASLTRGNDELTVCRWRRRSKAFRITLGNAPA